MIQGYATPEGTRRFAHRFSGKTNSEFFRQIQGLTLSTLGFGTYLGDLTSAEDKAVAEALKLAISGGINVIDTSINYRAQRSERVIGEVIEELIDEGLIRRDEIFISTKGGFIPFDEEEPEDHQAYFRDRFIKPKILTPGDVVAGCHSLAPKYIADQFESSRENLGLETIDLYFLHNPEIELEEINHDDLLHRFHRAFTVLEERRSVEHLQYYGAATWEGFRVVATSKNHLDLSEIIDAASDHGSAHGFKFIQLPFNLAMPEALSVKSQGGSCILQKAHELGVNVFASASLMQGKVVGHVNAQLDGLAPGKPDAVKALNYVRSAPGLDVALCGMKKIEHVTENLELAQVPLARTDSLRPAH